MSGVAAGLGAFGFWMFIAAVVVAGIWYDARKRESQQETLRRIVESGREIDRDVLDEILDSKDKDTKDMARDLWVAGVIVAFVSPGLALLGWFLGRVDQDALNALLGVSALVAFVAAGLLIAAKYVESQDTQG